VDLIQGQGMLVPESLYMRYKVSWTGQAAASTAVTGAAVKGTPVYSFFSRMETIIGSQTVESITQYGQMCNMVVNSRLNYSSKVGLAYPFGYNLASTATGGFDNAVSAPNGGYITGASGSSFFYAAPLPCILSAADRLVPISSMPSIRLQLSVDSLLNVIKQDTVTANNTPTAFTITNFEVCYDVVTFSPLVEQAISARGNGMIVLKSSSYLSSGVTLPISTPGTLEFVFNQRLASIKSVFLHLSGADATKLNGFFDSVDCTSSNGDYQFFIGGVPYPSRPLSTVLNKAGIFMEMSQSYGVAHDLLTSQFAINPTEFNYVNGSTTTINQMGKFYPSCNVEKLSTNDALLTGISSDGSPISVRISLGTPTTVAQVIQLICMFDCLLTIDLQNKTVQVMQ
jgi:hypothetical protein